MASVRWTKKETLHFAKAGREFAHGDAACELICFGREKQSSIGRSVVAGKICELAVEVLKTETDAEPCGIFLEKRSRVSNILISFGPKDVHAVFKQKQETRLLSSP